MMGDSRTPARDGEGFSIPGYKCLKLVGEGGMGLVYLAEQLEPIKRRVAIKVVRNGVQSRDDILARFEAERQALALMDHPNIARIYGAGQSDEGLPYVVMEWVPGQAITEYCQEKELSLHERLQVFRDVCSAVQHAHQKAIIHRDLKPSNVLVCQEGGKHVPKVIDFGIAKAVGAQILTDKTLQTQVGQFIGTPAYASPEQASMGPVDVDTRTDVYSLGAILYELLTNASPLDLASSEASSPWELYQRICEEEPSRPSQRLRQQDHPNASWARNVQGDLDWIVMKALSKDRDRRYATANQLSLEVGRVLAHKPVEARPPSWRYQVSKLVQRNKGTVVAACVVAVALLLASFFSIWQAIRATRYATLADQRLVSERVAKEEAESAQAHIEHSMALADYHTGQALAEQQDPHGALAYLVRSLEREPDQPAAADRLFSILTQTDLTWECLPPLGTQSSIAAIDVDATGNRVVIAHEDGQIQVWALDASAWKLLWQTDHGALPTQVTFSPDTQHLLCSGLNGCTVHQAATGDLLHSILADEKEDWLAVEYAPGGNHYVTTSWIRGAAIWNATTFELVRRLPHKEIRSARYSSDGEQIVTASQTNRDVRIFDARSGWELHRVSLEAEVWEADFSPSGGSVVILTNSSNAYLWDFERSQDPMALRHEGDTMVRAAAFSPDGALLATGAHDHTARIWDVSTGEERQRFTGRSEMTHVDFFGPRRLLTVERVGSIQTWNVDEGRPLSIRPMNVGGATRAIHANPAKNLLVVAGGQDIGATFWNLTSRSSSLLMPLSFASGATLTHDGRNVVMADAATKTLQMFDAHSGSPQATTASLSSGWAQVVGDPRSKGIYSGGRSGILTRFDEQLSIEWECPTGAPIERIEISDGGIIATSSRTSVSVCTDNGKALHTISCHFNIQDLALSPESALLLVGLVNGHVLGIDVSTGQKVFTAKHRGPVNAMAWSPNGDWFVAASEHLSGTQDETIHLWSRDGQPLRAPLKHASPVEALAISDDGRWIASGSAGGKVILWDSENHQPLQIIQEDFPSTYLTFAPSSDTLGGVFTGETQAFARLWEAPSGRPLSERLWQRGLADRLEFSSDQRRLLVSGQAQEFAGATTEVWEVSLGADSANNLALAQAAKRRGAWQLDQEGLLQYQRFRPHSTSREDRSSIIDHGANPFFPPKDDAYLSKLRQQPGDLWLTEALKWQTSPALLAKRAATSIGLEEEANTLAREQAQTGMNRALKTRPISPETLLYHGIYLTRVGDYGFGIQQASAALESGNISDAFLIETIECLQFAKANYATVAFLLGEALRRPTLSHDQRLRMRHYLLKQNLSAAFFNLAREDWHILQKEPSWIENKLSLSLIDELFDAASIRASVLAEQHTESNVIRSFLRLALLYRHAREAWEPSSANKARTHRIAQQLIAREEASRPLDAILAAGSRWRYSTTFAPDWQSVSYNDDEWAEGAGELGFGDGNEATSIDVSAADQPLTAVYFRTRFQVSDDHANTPLRVRLLRDDGAVIYIDGQEILRRGVGNAVITPETLATETLAGLDEQTFEDIALPSDFRLEPGERTLAVSIHQAHPNSSDISFDLELRPSPWHLNKYFASMSPADLEALVQELISLIPPSIDLPFAALLEAEPWPLESSHSLKHWVARARMQHALGRPTDAAFRPVLEKRSEEAASTDQLLLLLSGFQLLGDTTNANEIERCLPKPTGQSPRTRKHLVDLTESYNVVLWHPDGWLQEDSPILQWGAVQPSWEGIPFDIGGAVQLAGGSVLVSPSGFVFPRSVTIPVQRQVQALSLLHACVGAAANHGDEIAVLQIVYDGDQAPVAYPLRHGIECTPWRSTEIPHPDTAVFVPDSAGRAFQCTRTIWENPHPDVPIASIELRSGKGDRPFTLFGLLAK